MQTQSIDVIIIGAGIAGLTAAKLAKQKGKKVLLLEASDGVGGRVRTDYKDGFLLDRGFQVLLTSYPTAQEILNYQALDLKSFKPGAVIHKANKNYRIADPLRDLQLLFTTLLSPVGNFKDKLLLLRLKIKLKFTSVEEIFNHKETSTQDYLQNLGFSNKFIENFFRPFFSGIFLEQGLTTSSRLFEFLFKMFSEGDAAVPAQGMGKISEQLASHLSPDELMLNESVTAIEGTTVTTKSGKKLSAKAVIVATDFPHLPVVKPTTVKGKSALTLYFNAPFIQQPSERIALNANQGQHIRNIAIMDHISSAYAPKRRSLVAVSLNTDLSLPAGQIELQTRNELLQWYSDSTNWKLLAIYDIPYALPNNQTVKYKTNADAIKLHEHCYLCGDHLLYGSVNAAMDSAKFAVETMLKYSFNQNVHE
jgi:hypothetical protein